MQIVSGTNLSRNLRHGGPKEYTPEEFQAYLRNRKAKKVGFTYIGDDKYNLYYTADDCGSFLAHIKETIKTYHFGE